MYVRFSLLLCVVSSLDSVQFYLPSDFFFVLHKTKVVCLRE